MDIFFSWPVALVVAFIPALVRLWQDRALLRFENDPTLPERLLARRKTNQVLMIFMGVLTSALLVKFVSWFLPLLILSDVAAGYPLRKRLFGETWSLPAYLWFATRMLVANLGFWILLALTPAFAGAWGTPPWIIPVAVAVLLLAWHERMPEAVRWLLRVRPVSDAALLARFEDLARRSKAPMPRFECLELHGGVLVNAFALASRRTASVIFTETLLAKLAPDESVAICAHEIAHLEYYDRARLRRYALVTRALIVSAALVPALPSVAPSAGVLVWILWPLMLVSAVIWRAKDRQRNETISDQRAVALTGNAEALAQGLIKLYASGRVPRRFSSELEQRATHPSLARRIRDIRTAAGTSAPVPAATETFASADGATQIAFEPSRLRWTAGATAEQTLAYSGLTELRVHASGTADPRLIAVDGTGHKWVMPIAPADAGRLQSALDGVDGLLAAPVRAARMGSAAIRLCALLVAMLTLGVGQIAVVITAVAAMIAPVSAFVAALGVACITAAAVMIRSGRSLLWPFSLLIASVGAGICVLAYVKWNDGPAGRPRLALALLTVTAAIPLLLIPITGLEPVRLHQAVETLPSAPTLLLALGIALALQRGRRARLATAGVLLVAASVVFTGSMTFLERVGRDPLLVRVAPAHVTRLTDPPVAQYDVPPDTSAVVLSPNGSAYVLSRDAGAGGEPLPRQRWRHQVSRAGRTPRDVIADTAVFIDDDRLVTAEFGDAGVELKEVAVDDPAVPLRTQHVDGVVSGTLTASADAGWRLLGRAPDLSFISVHGRFGSPEVDVQRWRGERGAPLHAIESSGAAAIAVSREYETGPLAAPRYLGVLPLLLGVRSTSTFWRLDAAGATPSARSQLDATCADSVIAGSLACAVFDGVNTRIATVGSDGRIAGIATLDGRFATLPGANARGWLTGWTMGAPTAIRLATGEAYTVPRPVYGYIRALAASDTRIAAIISDRRRPRLGLYAVPR